ncbi:hypothetical protein Aduo_010255 [Ancylostoma duodenale]
MTIRCFGTVLATLLFYWYPRVCAKADEGTEAVVMRTVAVAGTVFCGKALPSALIYVRFKLPPLYIPPDGISDRFGEFLADAKEEEREDVLTHVWIRAECDDYCTFGFPLNIPGSSFSEDPGDADTVIDVGAIQLKDPSEKFVSNLRCDEEVHM